MQRAHLARRALLAASLSLALTAAADAQCVDDYLEPNDSCAAPTLVYGGFAANLVGLYGDDDYFQVHVPAGQDLTIALDFLHAFGDLDLYLTDLGCTSLLASSTSITDDELVQWSNTGGSGVDVVARVHMYAPNPDVLCNDYGVSFGLSTPTLCQDDNEFGNLDNDVCGDANLVFPDVVYLAMGVLDTDSDYYKITVPAGDTLTVDLTFTHALGDIDLRLWNADCTSNLASSTSVDDDESLAWTNTGATAVEVKWHVYLYSGTCNTYHMFASLVTPGCGPEDPFEDNDTCAQAWALGMGGQQGLVVQDADPDFFAFQVAMGQTLSLDVSFLHANGDVDLRLWDACGGALIASSGTVGDAEHVAWNNYDVPNATVYLEVFLYAGTCNTYDLAASTSDLPPGVNFCVATPNSTGAPAHIGAMGTRSIAANDITLYAEQIPMNQPGLFYYGPNAIQVPFGNGVRCVGGTVYRLPIFNPGPFTNVLQPLDQTHLPAGSVIVPGSTWRFQAWFRDPAAGGAFFDLTEGYEISFLP